MSARMDLHILTGHKTRQEWLEQAIASVAGQPVNLRVIDNSGHATGIGRAQAYRESTAEFVAGLDDDDALLPGAIAACIAALDANPAALGAYTDALSIDESGQVLGPDISTGSGPWTVERSLTGAGHTEHLAVMRRSAVLPFLAELESYTGMEQYFLHGMLATVGDWIHVEQPGYLFRLHADNTHNATALEIRHNARQLIRQRLTAAGRVAIPRIDVHVLYCYEPIRWIDDALISLAAEPVNVHLMKGIQGQVGLARARAFRQGTAEYVAFVDADDEVVSGAFNAALAVLDARPEIVATYCDVQLIGEPEGVGYFKAPWNPLAQLFGPSEVHHLHVMRRSAVEPHLAELERWDGYEEYTLMGLICQFGRQYHIPYPWYRFRQHQAYPRAGAIGGNPPAQSRRAAGVADPVSADSGRSLPMINWRNEPDGYAVATLTTTGAVLAIAETDAPGPVQWGSRWIAEGGHRESAVLAIDGQTARILQGQNAGQGLLVVWASADGILSNELVLMLLGAGTGSASDGGGLGDDRSAGGSNSGDSGDSGGSVNALALLPIQGQARLSLTAVGNLHSVKPLQAKAKLRLIARHGAAQPPSGLGMQMKIIADPYRPEVILDQSLRVWFNGHPGQCKVALKMDDSAEFQPAFIWQNPGVTQPAILKIDRAEIAGDGQSHLIKVSVWQAVGNRTSARATLSDYAKTPTVRPATQPEWCGATPIRQGETLYSTDGYHSVIGHISDLTRIDWRHTGAVQIMAKVPVANEKTAGFHQSIVILGYADHDETTFVAEAVGLLIGWRNGLLHEVLFGVAAIHGGQFGPVTWASAPVHIREILHRPAGPPLTPDEQAGTARKVTGHLDIRTYPGTFNLEVRESVLTHLGTLPTHGNAIIDQSLYRLFIKIKNIVRQGGSVTLNDLGRFEARWNETRTVRSVGFVASPGFMDGTRAGYVLTDAQAKALKP